MSTFKVEISNILDVQPHPNADRLDLVTVKGWNCVTARGNFKKGDFCVYIPVDSVLPSTVEAAIFGPDSKVKLSNSRVKTIKLRGAISQGLVVTPELLGLEDVAYGEDVTEILGIKKYEPPVRASTNAQGQAASKKNQNPNFAKYTGLENIKNYPDLFAEGEMVVAREKIHGTNFRAGKVPFNADTWWKKALQLIRLQPKFEFVYGSHNVQLQNKFIYKGFYQDMGNVYAKTVTKYNLKEKLFDGEVVYGEIYGDGIQKGFTYGCAPGEQKLVVFDVMKDGRYLNEDELHAFCSVNGFEMAPKVYEGPFDLSALKKLAEGPSVLAPSQPIREGLVIRPTTEAKSYAGRKILKMISDAYWLLQHGGADEEATEFNH